MKVILAMLLVVSCCTCGSASPLSSDAPISRQITNEEIQKTFGLDAEQARHLAGVLRAWTSGMEEKVAKRAAESAAPLSWQELLIIAVSNLVTAVSLWFARNRTRGHALSNITLALGDAVPTLATDHSGRPIVRIPKQTASS